jgi:predicted nucleotide-binding protein (sugar kinase/HSP70/actin superfamily)
MADEFITRSMHLMEEAFETYGPKKQFDKILDRLDEIIREGRTIIDPKIPQKPLIGVVGEIFLRMHAGANQDLIRLLERHGAEVVNASLAEWVNYISYEGLRHAKILLGLKLKQLRIAPVKSHLKEMVGFGADLLYKEFRQKQVYRRAKALLDIPDDHKIAHLEKVLEEDDLFSFEVGTEACLSIASILECTRSGYNGMVNVYPFTCMPSMTTSAIVKPLMNRSRVPYLDAPYDSGIQPGREAGVRTFMYQAYQHFRRHGRGA